MFQEFNTDTLESRLIKNIIYNTPLPIFKTIREGDWITTNGSYIYKRTLLRCTQSGFFNKGTPKAKYNLTEDYIFGNYYPKFTEKYMSHNIYYDHGTHEMLGVLLRCIRDISGVDLMPFYNCFSGFYTNAFHIRNDHIKDGPSSAYKVGLLPIRFNTDYTIAIDCANEITVMPLILNEEVPVISVFDGQFVDLSESIRSQTRTYSNTSFRQPFVFSVKTYDDNFEDIPYAQYLQQNETNLCLAIQIPVTNESSIVVMEGNHTDLNVDKIIERDALMELSEDELNKVLTSPLSLFIIDDKNSYAFSDRLIEYLTLNVVAKDEEIDNNIALFQKALGLTSYVDVSKGVWNDVIRFDAYEYYKENYTQDTRLRFLDINGYIDKDIERLLLKGKLNVD